MKFSYCCGKPVRRTEGVNKRGEGYHCSRCKKELTLYGNPKNELDKMALKEKRAVKGRGHKVLSNSDLQLIDIVYKSADEETKSEMMHSDKWVVVDAKGNFIASIILEKNDGRVYEVFEPFENRLLKEKLAAFRLSTANYYGYYVEDMKKERNLRPLLEKMGWKFRKDGFIQ